MLKRKERQLFFDKILINCPQKKGICYDVKIKTPRKPNSAKRAIIKSFLTHKKFVTSFVPGIGHSLKKFSINLIAGSGPNDLPLVNYYSIRGIFDLRGVIDRRTSRSFYGISWKKKFL